MVRNRWFMVLVQVLAAAGFALAAVAQDKDSFTPMPLDAGFGRMDVTPPSVPPEEIVKKFAAKETEFQEALNHYTYRRTARMDTINGDTGKVDGEWFEVDDVIFTPDGTRMERVVSAPPSTLTRVMMSPSDLQDLQHGYAFVFTAQELPAYNVNYVGRQKVDDLDCYVFEVAPKVIEKKKRYFDGRVWVDAKDLQVVVSNGRMVPDDTKKDEADLHPPFMTWRAQIDGKYWFPVYTKAEGNLHFGSGYVEEDVYIRDVIKYADYKRYGSSIKVIYDGEDITNKGEQPTAQPPSTDKKK